jgi:hypothetical protein
MRKLFIILTSIVLFNSSYSQSRIYLTETTDAAYNLHSAPFVMATTVATIAEKSFPKTGINPIADKDKNLYTHDVVTTSTVPATITLGTTTTTYNNKLYKNGKSAVSLNVYSPHFLYVDPWSNYYDITYGALNRSSTGFTVIKNGLAFKKINGISGENFGFIDSLGNVYTSYYKMDTLFAQKNGINFTKIFFYEKTAAKTIAFVDKQNAVYSYLDDPINKKTIIYRNNTLFTNIPWGLTTKKFSFIY